MSFEGNLEDLSIVDVLQLIYSTKKSGTLTIRNDRNACEISLEHGQIVSATHPNPKVNVGVLLAESGDMNTVQIKHVMKLHLLSRENDKSFVDHLLEGEFISENCLCHALHRYVFSAIEDLLSWKKGTFFLELNRVTMSQDFISFQNQTQRHISINTQEAIFEALRIVDEGQLQVSSELSKKVPHFDKIRDAILSDSNTLDPNPSLHSVPVPSPAKKGPSVEVVSALDDALNAPPKYENPKLQHRNPLISPLPPRPLNTKSSGPRPETSTSLGDGKPTAEPSRNVKPLQPPKVAYSDLELVPDFNPSPPSKPKKSILTAESLGLDVIDHLKPRIKEPHVLEEDEKEEDESRKN